MTTTAPHDAIVFTSTIEKRYQKTTEDTIRRTNLLIKTFPRYVEDLWNRKRQTFSAFSSETNLFSCAGSYTKYHILLHVLPRLDYLLTNNNRDNAARRLIRKMICEPTTFDRRASETSTQVEEGNIEPPGRSDGDLQITRRSISRQVKRIESQTTLTRCTELPPRLP